MDAARNFTIGLFSGSMAMRVSQGAVTELAANMLGLDDNFEVSEKEQQKSVCSYLISRKQGDDKSIDRR